MQAGTAAGTDPWWLVSARQERHPDKIVGLCILAALLMSALGGCWWPLEVAPEWMQMAAHLVPTGWAMDGLHRLITFGGTAKEVLLPVGVLAGFGS